MNDSSLAHSLESIRASSGAPLAASSSSLSSPIPSTHMPLSPTNIKIASVTNFIADSITNTTYNATVTNTTKPINLNTIDTTMSSISSASNSTHLEHNSHFLQSVTAKFMATIFVWSAIFITCNHIYKHLKYTTMPSEQRYIVRILFIVPIYGFDSWLSFLYLNNNIYVYFDCIKDWYEAFVIYNFMSLLYEYLGGEGNIMSELRGKPIKSSWYHLSCCLSNRSYTIEFLRFCKQATLQFCAVKPLMSILTLYLQATDRYQDGKWSLSSSYVYITIIYNISVSLALYGLYLFYQATKQLLAPYEPIAKFLTIKSIIFLSYWQGLILTLIYKFGHISQANSSQLSPGALASGYQNFFISMEMLLASVVLRYAFPYEIYCYSNDLQNTVTMQGISDNLKDTVNPRDIMTDAIHNFHPQYQQYTQYTSTGNNQNSYRMNSSDDEQRINHKDVISNQAIDKDPFDPFT